MADDGPWLNVPQTAVLEVTRDIELVVGLSAKTTPLLIIKANQLLARIEIPLEANADADQRRDAVEQARTALRSDSANRRYLEALQRVRGRLVAGVRTKARGRRADHTRAWTGSNSSGPSLKDWMRSTKKPGPSSCSICSSTCTSTSNT